MNNKPERSGLRTKLTYTIFYNCGPHVTLESAGKGGNAPQKHQKASMTFTGKFIMNIYVVTSGNYSDYGIRSIFSTRGKAKEFIKRETRNALYEHYIGDDYRIETWELDKPLEPKIPIFFCYYYPENDSWKVSEEDEKNYGHEFNKVQKEPDYGETDNTKEITLPVSGLKAIIGPYKEE
jgi:hypothetical protein